MFDGFFMFAGVLLSDTLYICERKAMNINQIAIYVNSNEHIGLDKVLKLQLKIDGWLAYKIDLSSFGPIEFMFGFLIC